MKDEVPVGEGVAIRFSLDALDFKSIEAEASPTRIAVSCGGL
jgi:hypothetical protein